MAHSAVRARLWWMIGISPLAVATCARDGGEARFVEPAPEPLEPPASPPQVATDAGAEPGADSATAVVTTVAVDPDAAALATQSLIPEPPPGTWFVEAPTNQRWCTTRSLRCQSGHLTPPSEERDPKTGCPASLTVACSCSPASPCLEPSLGCSAALDTDITRRERLRRSSIVDGCCYSMPQTCVPPYVGRPLWVAGELRTAPSVPRRDWTTKYEGDATGLFADEWRRIAELEHSSVASFARTTLGLLSLGAPAELLGDVQLAARDEIEHARLAYGVASRLCGEELGPGPLCLAGLAPPPADLETLARETLREGCVEETVGAIVARERAALGPAAEVFTRIADDEERHAALAFRILRFALEAGGERVAGVVRDELTAILAQASDQDGHRARVLIDVVAPTVARLLDSAGVNGVDSRQLVSPAPAPPVAPEAPPAPRRTRSDTSAPSA